jgi:hypothetical protein
MDAVAFGTCLSPSDANKKMLQTLPLVLKGLQKGCIEFFRVVMLDVFVVVFCNMKTQL